MSEEKKEEKIEKNPEVTAQPVAVPQAPAAAQVPPAAPQAPAPAQSAPAAKKEEPKKEKPSNCASCNKSIKNRRRYYRDGKFYCTKRCWATATKKKEEPKEAPQS